MNAKMSYKKAVVLIAVFMTLGLEAAGCSPCQQAAAARKSIKDEQAKLAATQKPKRAELDEASDVNAIESCCPYCAAYGIDCGADKRCAACQGSAKDTAAAMLEMGKKVAKALGLAKEMDLDLDVADAADRAARPSHNSCKPCAPQSPSMCTSQTSCQVDCEKPCEQNKCCDIKKCCKKLKHKIEDVEDLVESVIDINCCSITEALLETVIDQTAACCSVTNTLITSVRDQTAACCSVTNTTLGALDGIGVNFPICNFSVTDFVNGTQIDVIRWLKSLYLLTYQIYLCTCCGDN